MRGRYYQFWTFISLFQGLMIIQFVLQKSLLLWVLYTDVFQYCQNQFFFFFLSNSLWGQAKEMYCCSNFWCHWNIALRKALTGSRNLDHFGISISNISRKYRSHTLKFDLFKLRLHLVEWISQEHIQLTFTLTTKFCSNVNLFKISSPSKMRVFWKPVSEWIQFY